MRYFRGLRVQILLWTILPLILILVTVSLGSINLHQHSMRDMVAERDAHLAEIAAARLDDLFQSRITALETIRKSTNEPGELTQALANIEPLLELFDQGVVVYDGGGVPLTAVSQAFAESAPQIRQMMAEAQSAQDQLAYQLISGSGKPWLLLMALYDPETGRVIVGATSQGGMDLPRIFEQINRHPETEVYLIAPGGRVIYHQDEGEINRDYSIHSGVRQALSGEAGATFEHLEGEEEHVVGYAPVLQTGWALLIEEPWANVIVPGLQYTLWTPILVLVAAIASLAALHFGLWRVIHPLQVLGREASRLAWGDFQAIEKPVGGIAEIRDLQSTLQEMAAQIHRYQDGMHDYIAVLTQTQEEERRRLARELHDVIVQTVIAMGQRVKILQMDWQEQCHETTPAVSSGVDLRLHQLSEMIRQCLDDVRNLIRDLRPIYLEELGLVSALETLARGADAENVQTAFEVTGEERSLARDTNLAIFRVAQSAMNNALRHGQPDFVRVQLAFQEDGVVLTVEDNGAGFVPPERPSDLALQGHFGLVGMFERATRLGGHLSIRSEPGAGTTITAFLPYTVSGMQVQAS